MLNEISGRDAVELAVNVCGNRIVGLNCKINQSGFTWQKCFNSDHVTRFLGLLVDLALLLAPIYT